jgi:regulator of protease activity HflC (stomatin/prohibitin superfamily)
VPVDVDAIAFWVVYDAEQAALEVQDYQQAVILAAQSALRDAIGKHDLAELIQSARSWAPGSRRRSTGRCTTGGSRCSRWRSAT